MYYLGEASRGDASQYWYHRAAQLGDPYAMLRLHSGNACEWDDICPDDGEDWAEVALYAALPRAEAGDVDAMFALYPVYATLGDSSAPLRWLTEAAKSGNVEAQNWLGHRIHGGHVSYPSDTERLEAAEQWLRKAAEAGYPRAMTNLAATLSDLGRYEEAWQWLSNASEAGYVTGRLWKAYCHIDPEEDGMCQTEKDPAKGWAFLLAVHEEAPGVASERSLESYGDGIHVTPEQREEGEKSVDDWLNHEPPLSYFPMKFFGP